ERLRGDDEAWRADAALQRGVLEKHALQRVQRVAARDALDGRDRSTVRFRREDETGRHQASVEEDRARAAVAGRAAFLRARQPERVAKRRDERLVAVAEELGRLAVDGGVDMEFHRLFSARAAAIFAARRVSTPTTVRRYAAVPRLSSIGLAAAPAASAAARSADSSSVVPTSARAAAGTSSAVGATAPIATRAAVQVPAGSSVTLTAAPATAMSISLRGM